MTATKAATDLLERAVSAGTIPGGVIAVGRDEPTITARGAMAPDAIVRIQSMTKVVSAVATLRLVEAGRLTLDADVTTWLPELADRRVLASPTAELTDTVAAEGPITVRHLLTCTSGYGMQTAPTPLAAAMTENGTEAGPEVPPFGADEWLARLAALPLTFQPGTGWRYHHSFGILQVLLSRLVGHPLGEHLAADLFEPLGLVDTGFWVPAATVDRLPAAYRHTEAGLVETEPAAGGFYAGPPPFDVSHNELVSTAADYHRFVRALAGGELISRDHLRLLSTDQVPVSAKTDDAFFPGFWSGTGWGYGVAVVTEGEHAGRFGWSGGQGTDFFLDADGSIGILLTQVEMGDRIFGLINEFQQVPAS